MSPDELQEIGEQLYGKNWQTELAKELEIEPRTVRHYAAGTRGIPKPTAKLIRVMLAMKL